MKTYIKYLAAATALLSLTACDWSAIVPDRGPKPIVIKASIGLQTKVTTDSNKATFDAGDKITVYAWTGDKTAVPATRVVDAVANTYGSDGKWTPATQMLWADDATPHFFLGIWPAQTVTDFAALPYTLDPADKTSDLLIATELTGLKPASDVALVFDHMVAKLCVNLSFRNQWATTPTVTSVSATAKKTATVDCLAKAVTATGDAAKLALVKESDAAWSSLEVPQTGFRTITVTIDGKDFVYTHTGDIPLESGKITTVNLLVGRDRIDPGAMTISNWITGTTIDGGEAQDD